MSCVLPVALGSGIYALTCFFKFCRYPPAPRGHITSKPEANPGAAQAEIVCLQQQLVEARAANQKLGAIIKHQQSTIDQLQVPFHLCIQASLSSD